jgi:hypothetical protein
MFLRLIELSLCLFFYEGKINYCMKIILKEQAWFEVK